ncbi:helix-turn-helix domain-containing protein [Paenibacillus ehimensis]|uniref:helix-turn-helix domain-containing protein n=1 Tax=Paenibacillus ehimensis TaxID=79264 RepID=UPI00046F09E1|nr:helix-turn-helix transcriptional regulator [Paenibacillus ehimensis]
MNFTKAVLAAMTAKGLKKSELARATGYTYQHIYDLLSGERRWNEDSINKVCEALGIKIEITHGGGAANE